jgi:drug/metabolite transporter (DMT)-like permease
VTRLSGISKNTAYLYATLSITFWGVSFVSTKAALEEVSLFPLVAIRFSIGSLFLFFLLLCLREKLTVQFRHLPQLLLLGGIGVFLHQLIQVAALQTTDATAAGWLITLSPIFTAILAIFFLQDKLTKNKVIGMTVAMFGVLLLTSGGNLNSFSTLISWGNVLMIVSALNWAIYSIVLKKMNLPYSSLTITFYTSVIGCLFIFPFAFWDNGLNGLSTISLGVWLHLLFLGIFVSALGYLFWGKALESLDATRVSVFLYLEPLATLIAAIILLNEAILFSTIAGGVIIVLGVIFVNGQVDFIFRRRITKSSDLSK